MKLKKMIVCILACTVIGGAASLSMPDFCAEAVYAADAEISGNIKIQPVYEDFNENDVNGAVEIALPEGITARVTVTFDSAEGKSLPYYDSLIDGGSSYIFGIEGALESDERLYTLSILPISAAGFEATADYTEQFSVKDGDDFPGSFVTYRYDIRYNYDFEGESWRITGGEDGNKEITFSFSKYAMGDVDMDGKITAFDAASVLTEYTELAAGRESSLNANQKLVADVDEDGKITAFDAAKILTYYTELAAGREPSWD